MFPARFSLPGLASIALVLFGGQRGHGEPAEAAPAAIEDAAERSRLPEFQVIPAAPESELTPALPVAPDTFTAWTRSQGDSGSRRFSALQEVNRANVGRLRVAWVYHSNDGADDVESTPIVVGDRLFAATAGQALIALKAATGEEIWRRQLGPTQGVRAMEDPPARRGLVYWPGDSAHPERLLVGAGRWIYALDPRTGRGVAGFGEDGRVSIPTGATVSGAVYRNVFVTSGLFGDAYGYDVGSGALLWRFHSIPRTGEFGADSWQGSEAAGANGWGGVSVDEQRGIAYVAFGNARPDMIGTGRLGDNLFSDCVVALDARTGTRRWHFQDTRHDIWDLDVCAPPNLVTITRHGRRVDAVTAVSKGGTLMLLDRVSGKPIFPFRLRRAPTSQLPGERTAPYQPDPELPERISSPEFKLSDITTRTPAAHDFVLRQVQKSDYGFYRPHREGRPTLFIGSRGGAEWSGAAVDVATGRLYVTSNRWVSKITVVTADERERDPRYPPSAGERHYQTHCAACHGPTRAGIGTAPPLLGLKQRLQDADVLALLKTGRGAMPPNLAGDLSASEKGELLDYLFRRRQPPSAGPTDRRVPDNPRYTFTGYNFLVDDEGYPGIKPPWGLLNCYDLNTGRVVWRVPLGEIAALTKQGVPITGSQNLGGATVTAGGLVFCAGTADQKLRAFDSATGRELWSAKLPFAGTAAPAVYEVAGRQFIVITATGGGRVGGPAGDAYVAFALGG
jgi:quinoprotein glucose dehydrogenase